MIQYNRNGIYTHNNEVKEEPKKVIYIRKYIIAVCLILMLFITVKGVFGLTPYTIQGDHVFINDSNVYLNVYPHTNTYEGEYIYPSLLSKGFSGAITVIYGYDNDNVQPLSFEYKTVNNYTSSNGTIVINETWNNINVDSNNKVNWNYGDVNTWRYVSGLNIQSNVLYDTRIRLNTIGGDSGKYWFCVMPSAYGSNLQQANTNGHLYCLDPWYNISNGYSFNQTNLDTNIVAYYSFQENNTGSPISIPNKVNNLTNNASVVGNASIYANGKYGRGLYTDGVSGFISLFDTNNNLDFGNGEWCINYWENRTSAVDGKGVYTRENTAIFTPLLLGYSYGGNATVYSSTNGASWDCLAGVNMGSFSVNNWSMFTSTVIGGRFMTYKNGNLISNVSYACNLPAKADDARFGQVQGSYTPDRLDEIGIWKGVGCNASMVSDLWSNGNGYFYTDGATFQNFNIIAYNNRTNATIFGFNATINSVFFNTSNGQITTNLTNTSIQFNISINSSGYYPYIATNYNWTLTPLIYVYLEPISPTSPSINSPYNNVVVNQFLNITYNTSTAQVGSIQYYNITLLNSNGSLKQILIGNNSLNTSYYWNIYDSNLSLGNYKVMVEALDTNGLKTNYTNNITVLTNSSSSYAIGGVSSEYSTLYLRLNTQVNITNISVTYNGTVYSNTSNVDYGSYIIYSQSVYNPFVGNISYFWNISFVQINNSLDKFIINNSLLVNNLNLTINLFDENTNLKLQNFNTSVLLQNLDTNQQFILNNNVSQFNFTNLSSGNYYISITPSNTSYYNRVYNIIINSSNPSNMNAYIGVGSQVVLSYSDVDSGDALEDVLVTMYRTVNGSVISVESRYTDITGRVQFTYVSNIAYEFFSAKQGYTSLSYPLNPVLFSSYNIKMTKTDTSPSGYDDVNVYYTPQSFDCNYNYNFVWSILSKDQLTGYAFAFNNVSYIGSLPSGETVVNPINISCAGGMQWVTLYYNYTTDNNVSRQFSKTFFISGTRSATNYTFANNKVSNYGMGWFERMVIITIIVICVTGVASLLVGGVGGLVVGLLTLGYFANIFTVNKFIIAFTVIIGVLIVISRMKEQ